MTEIITVTDGVQIAVGEIDVQLASTSPIIDMFSRLRVSEPLATTTIKQDSQTMKNLSVSEGFVVANAQMTTSYVSQYTDIISTGTAGHYRLRSCRPGLYRNGMSGLIFFTFNFVTTGTTGVIKRVGYFNQETNLNGIWLEQNGTTVSWNLANSTGAVRTTVNQASWNATTQPTLDWTKSQIGFIAFEYLGVGDIICGFVQDRQLKPTHTFSSKNALTTTYMASPCLFLTYEMVVSRATTTEERFRTICATALSEGTPVNQSFAFSLSRLTGFNVTANTKTVIFAFRSMVPSQITRLTDVFVAHSATGTAIISVEKATTIGNLPAATGTVNGIEYYLPTAGNVTFTSEYTLSQGIASSTDRFGSLSNVRDNTGLETNFDNTGSWYIVTALSTIATLGVTIVICNFSIEY